MFGQAGHTDFDFHFSLFGIPVRVHPLFWLMSAWLVWEISNGDPRKIILGIAIFFISVLIHELGHAYFSRKYGHPSEVVLYLLGGYATTSHFQTRQRIIVSLAGPGFGFALFALLYVTYRLLAVFQPSILGDNDLVRFGFSIGMFANFMVNLMNLVPTLPLDGGRVMEALMMQRGGRNATQQTMQISIGAAIAIAGWALYCMQTGAEMVPLPDALFPSFKYGRYIYFFPTFQPSPKFILIFFGFLAATQIVQYNETYRGYR